GEVLKAGGRAGGGKRNLAGGGLGAFAGALPGGGTRSMGGALGGGAMALIGAIAFKALQGAGQKTDNVPLGLLQPRNQAEQQKLEQQTELVLKAMINAAKSDGRISEDEIQRIVGKLKEAGAQDDDMRYVMSEMQKPIDTYSLMAAAKGQPELAAELYAASLMAIEVDTTAEKAYLQELAGGMGLSPEVTRQIDQMVGL
ncbi:MAG: tellurite resistance TerB family protein, partial [Thermovirgaceae bacterium]